jgi:hypothetical protein
MDEIVTELQAVVFYLKLIGAMYPIAPEKAIETIERAIDVLQSEKEAPRKELTR